MGASWLKNYLAPVKFLVNSIAQIRDDRVNFRNGFTSSQVSDADGNPVLTIDTVVSNAQYEPIAGTIPLRNGSGTLKGNVITSTSYTYVSPVTIQYEEQFNSNAAMNSGDWSWSFERVPATGVNTPATWSCDLNLVPGSIMKTVSAVYQPASGHLALPTGADRTHILFAVYLDDGTLATSPVIVYDDPASIVDYETSRTVTIDLSGGITVVAGRLYRLLFISEGGADALSGTILRRQARWTALVSSPRA